jgi:small conductance mechanosensitive channel
VSISDLERLVQQIEDPSQREQLLNTLQALIVAAKQAQSAAPSPPAADPSPGKSSDLFRGFDTLTAPLATVGRTLGQVLITLPVTLSALPTSLMQPDTLQRMGHLGIVIAALIMLTLLVRLLASRWVTKLRDRRPPATAWPLWRQIFSALATVGLRAGPYLILLPASGMILSLFPLGAVLTGLVATVVQAFVLYQWARTIVRVLLDPAEPSARLLPISDTTARQAWTWSLRVLNLSAAYHVVTHSLLLTGVSEAVYDFVRGVIVIAIAVVLSMLVSRVARAQRMPTTEPLGTEGQRIRASAIATFKTIWPIIAIAYIWCAAFFAIVSFHQGVTYLVVASLQMAVVIGVSLLLLWAGNLAVARAVAMHDRVGQYLPGLEGRVLRYVQTMWWGVQLLIVAVGALIIIQVWGVRVSWVFTSPVGRDLLTRLITSVFTWALVALLVDFSAFIGQRFLEPGPDGGEISKKRRTLIPLLSKTVKYGALFIGALVTMHQVGINVTPILAGVGILSLAVGFGAQTLVKDIINGLFILFEDSIAVGDVVTVKGTGGLVEAVNLRTIRLRDLQGSVHVIPNSQVDIITNMTKEFSYYVLDVGVAYREDTDEVIAALQDIDAGMRQDPAYAVDMLDPIDILGVDRFDDSAVIVKARLKTKPIRQWYVGREFNRRMKKLFDERGIEIPFPHRTLYWGEPKRGAAAAMHLDIHNLERLIAAPHQGARQEVASQSAASDAH